MFTREATREEVANYNMVETAIGNFDDEQFEKTIEIIGDYVYNFKKGKEAKRVYNRIYNLAKRTNTTVQALVDWYCME